MRTGGIVLAAAALATAAAAATTGRPDLSVTRVGVSKTIVFAGASFRASDTTKNRGVGVGRTVTAYFLVRFDPQRGNTSMSVGARVIASLRAGKSSSGSRRVRTSKSLEPGIYRIKVCADHRRTVKESNEKNNCRLSPKLTIKTPPLPE